RLVIVVAEEAADVLVERFAELPELGQPPPDLTADFRELGRAEDEQRHDQDDQKVPRGEQALHDPRAYPRHVGSPASRGGARTGCADSVLGVDADVCVVGGGYAGLTAARRITRAGASVIVLEARDRVGGRVWTRPAPNGTPIDMGGTWLGP